MVKVENLTKIYDQSKKNKCVALDNINFNLLDKGIVFIIGKSGSGKSTLLNMLGGLDKLTSGEITAFGNKFSEFKPKDYDNYRNNCLGFIFQDYCLIENISVYKNVELALKLQNKSNKEEIYELLDKVGLKGYESRLPKKLSGGQKQRVAIARALIKHPKLILADEPTGNLDGKTSLQIMDLFKEISKENLVVIVSHNLDIAKLYGDQIITLDSGKVIENVVRNKKYSNEIVIKDNQVILPKRELTNKEIEDINSLVLNKKMQLVASKEKFIKEDIKENKNEEKFSLKSIKNSFKNIFSLSMNFSKKRKWSNISISIITCLLISLLAMCQMLSTYDSTRMINNNMDYNNMKVISLKRGYRSDSGEVKYNRQTEITDKEIQKFYNNGYKGKIFKFYSLPLAIAYGGASNDIYQDALGKYSMLYPIEGEGVLNCDLDYLKKIFALKNGELEIIEGSIKDDTTALIVTDFFADTFLHYNSDYISSDKSRPYASLVNRWLKNRFAIAAVIKTDYKEKYSHLIDKFETYYNKSSYQNQFKELVNSSEYNDFIENLSMYYNVAYNINPNYQNQETNEIGAPNHKEHYAVYGGYEFKIDDNKLVETELSYQYIMPDYQNTLKKGEVLVTPFHYNNMFNTNVSYEDSSEFKEKVVSINHYRGVNLEKVYSKELKIVGLTPKAMAEYMGDRFLVLNSIDKHELAKYSYEPVGLYFDNPSYGNTIIETGIENDFVMKNRIYDFSNKLTSIVNIFTDYYSIFGSVLFSIIIILLFSFSIGGVKKNVYEIGVCKAIGCKNRHIEFSFIIQIILLGIISAILSFITMYGLIFVLNGVLVKGFTNYYKLDTLNDINILKFIPSIYIFNMILTVLVLLISTLIPIILLRKIKPANIIKSKD